MDFRRCRICSEEVAYRQSFYCMACENAIEETNGCYRNQFPQIQMGVIGNCHATYHCLDNYCHFCKINYNKRCIQCKEWKPNGYFHKKHDGRNARQSKCKDCRKH